MSTYLSWQNALDDITTYSRKSKFFLKFMKLKTNEERIVFCLKDDFVKVRIQKWLTIMGNKRHKKNLERASKLRAEGNHHFHLKDYEKALEYYTQSIVCAPMPKTITVKDNTEELAIGYANRSAAFFHLNNYKESLKDIERAEHYGYPKELYYKLTLRKGQCLLKLNQKEPACKVFDSALEYLEEAKLDAKKIEKQQKEINSLKCTIIAESKEEVEDPSLPPIYKGSHAKLSFASAVVKLQKSAEKGRYIVSDLPISPGDILFVEPPYASVLLPQHYLTHCHHCYAKCLASVPCQNCSQVRYCSENCAQESWDKCHMWECGHLDLLHTVGIAHLSARVILMTGIDTINQELDKPLAEIEGCHEDGGYRNSYYSVYHLMSHVENMHSEDLLQYSLTAALLFLYLEKVGVVLTDDTFVGGLLLHHILQLVCNAHAITEVQTSPGQGVVSQRQVRIATAIYPTASLMNHSCDPSIISSFQKNVLIVRALKEIPAGLEIYNCYGPHFHRMAREDRQRALQDQYFFTCKCDTCTTEDDKEQRIQALKCPLCEGPLRLPDGSNMSQCLDCQREQECASQLQKVFAAHDLYVQGIQLAAKDSYKDALEKLHRCLRLRSKVMYRRNRQLAEVQDQLACCYASLGQFEAAVEYLRPTLDINKELYGPSSIEMGHELQKYSDLLLNAILQQTTPSRSLITEAQTIITEGIHIFTLHYGKHHEAVKELQEKQLHLPKLED